MTNFELLNEDLDEDFENGIVVDDDGVDDIDDDDDLLDEDILVDEEEDDDLEDEIEDDDFIVNDSEHSNFGELKNNAADRSGTSTARKGAHNANGASTGK